MQVSGISGEKKKKKTFKHTDFSLHFRKKKSWNVSATDPDNMLFPTKKYGYISSVQRIIITKTSLFKYIENFTTKN